MFSMHRTLGVALLACVFAGAAYGFASGSLFPRMRYGIGAEPTTGGGTIKGTPYRTKAAVMAWNRRQRSLTLYLVATRDVDCGNLKKVITRRGGRVIQALIKARPLRKYVGRPIPDQSLQFLRYPRNPSTPIDASGLTHGVKLVITRIDSYPRGVWHGTLTAPTRVYNNGLVYGYRGSFAARWCDLRK